MDTPITNKAIFSAYGPSSESVDVVDPETCAQLERDRARLLEIAKSHMELLRDLDLLGSEKRLKDILASLEIKDDK